MNALDATAGEEIVTASLASGSRSDRSRPDRKVLPMSDNEDESGSRADAIMPRGRYLSLNSKRLTASRLKQIAHSLSLPTMGLADQLRQAGEGNLATDGHETTSIQVVLEDRFPIDGWNESEPLKRDATDVIPD